MALKYASRTCTNNILHLHLHFTFLSQKYSIVQLVLMQQTTRMSLFWTLRRFLIFPCLHFQLYLHFFLPAYLSLQWWAAVAKKVTKSVHQKRVKSVKKRAETDEKWQKVCTRNGWKVLIRNGCSRLCSVVCCREGKVTLHVRLSAHTHKSEQCSTEVFSKSV